MNDRNRNQSQPNRGRQPQQAGSQNAPRQTDDSDTDEMRTSEGDRATRDRSSVADDRGLATDRDKRNVSSRHERDELGSDMENEPGLIEDDEEDERGGTGSANR